MTDLSTDRGIGDNRPAPIDYAEEETARLQREYPEIEQQANDLAVEATAHPKEIENDDQMLAMAATIKRARDFEKRLEGWRTAEKEPFLRRGDAVYGYFARVMGRMAKQKKTDNPGLVDRLQDRINDWQNKKAAEERARREAERIKAEAEARARRDQEEAERRAAREAEEKAARARNAETKAKHEAEAAARNAAAYDAQQAARAAEQRTDDARIQTAAPTADLVRTRGEGDSRSGGVTVTSKRVPYVEIVDRNALNLTLLAPFIDDAALLKALKAWAKVGAHRVKMDGAVIEMRDEAVVR